MTARPHNIAIPVRVACLDFGGTYIRGKVIVHRPGELDDSSRPVCVEVTTLIQRLTSKDPNDADADWENIRAVLQELHAQLPFDRVSVGMASRLDKRGNAASAGNLKGWARAGYNLGDLITAAFGVPAHVANDGETHVAYEIVFGALSQEGVKGLSGVLVAPGTGVAVCRFIFLNGRYHIFAGEGAHAVIVYLPPGLAKSDCGCGNVCVESMASGRALERGGTDPKSYSDDDVNDIMAPPLGRLIANLAVTMPLQTEVVVIGGGMMHHRSDLFGAIRAATAVALNGYVPVPELVPAHGKHGGVLGAWANWWLNDTRAQTAPTRRRVSHES